MVYLFFVLVKTLTHSKIVFFFVLFYNYFAFRAFFLLIGFFGVWVTLITRFFIVFSLNCFTLVSNDFHFCVFCGDDFFFVILLCW